MNLKFDVAVTDDLFKAYSQKHNCEFKPIGGPKDVVEYQLDKCDNKIYMRKDCYEQCGVKERGLDCSKILKNIARKVRENADLFAQIEANTRGMEADKVKKYDIELIAKEFEYYSDLNAKEDYTRGISNYNMEFKSNMPLCTLALLARPLYRCVGVHVISEDINSAVALHLFVQLCLEADCDKDSIAWSFKPMPEILSSIIESNGTTAVVTSTADIESALATLLDASQDYRYPWRLRRVLVQESSFGRFKRALARSTASEHPPAVACVHPPLAARCSSAHSLGDNGFLVEYCGADSDVTARQRLVLISAYRTTSELLTRLHSLRPSYVSLWCSDVSVSNEIALGVRCGVWLNNFAWLQGLHRRSHSWEMVRHLEALHSMINWLYPLDEHRIMTSLRAEWLKNGVEKRREVVLEVLRGKAYASEFEQLVESLAKWEPRSFVHIESGTSYQGFEEPRGVVGFVPFLLMPRPSLSELILSVVNGNGVYFSIGDDKIVAELVKDLNAAGVPVMLNVTPGPVDLCIANFNSYSNYDYFRLLYKTRVISCHFGETFAN